MIRTRFKNVLLVAPGFFPDQLLTDYKNVKHIENVRSLFPSLYELNPDLVILDCDYIGNDAEKIIRRIKMNKFYSKLKICCYKNVAHAKTDDLLKTLGVDYFVYQEDLSTPKKEKKVIMASLGTAVDMSIMKLMRPVSN